MEYNHQFKYEIEDNKIIIKIVMTRSITEIVIPDKIEGIPVTKICDGAFRKCKRLVKVFIPDTVEYIGDKAFSECEMLKEIRLPENLKKINSGLFSYCRKLKHINIPESVIEIGNTAFASCISIEEITIPGFVEKVMERAFADCIRLKSVIILSGKIRLGYRAFYHCRELNSVTVRYEYTKLDFSSQKELEFAQEIKVRICDGENYRDVKVFVPTDELKSNDIDMHRSYIELFQNGFTWEEYDNSYSSLKDLEKKIDVAAYRLICREGISEDMLKTYTSLLKKHSKTAIMQFVDYDDEAGIEVLAEMGCFGRFNINKYIKICKKKDSLKCAKFLIEYKQRKF